MSHTVIIITKSVLEIFDPDDPEYQGTRDHFSAAKLARIDALRALPETAEISFDDRLFVAWAVGKAIVKADNVSE